MKNKRKKRTSELKQVIRWFKIKKSYQTKFKFNLHTDPKKEVILLLLEDKLKTNKLR